MNNYSIGKILLFLNPFAQFHESESKQNSQSNKFISQLPRRPNPITQSINPFFFCCSSPAAFREQLFLEYYLPKIPFRSAGSSIVRADFHVNLSGSGTVAQLKHSFHSNGKSPALLWGEKSWGKGFNPNQTLTSKFYAAACFGFRGKSRHKYSSLQQIWWGGGRDLPKQNGRMIRQKANLVNKLLKHFAAEFSESLSTRARNPLNQLRGWPLELDIFQQITCHVRRGSTNPGWDSTERRGGRVCLLRDLILILQYFLPGIIWSFEYRFLQPSWNSIWFLCCRQLNKFAPTE